MQVSLAVVNEEGSLSAEIELFRRYPDIFMIVYGLKSHHALQFLQFPYPENLDMM